MNQISKSAAYRRKIFIKTVFPALLILLVLMTSRPVIHAQDCLTDQEPNNEPSNAQPLTSCAIGTLERDDQDLYRLTISEPAALRQITLDGVPRALTRTELFALEDDDSPRSIFALQSPNGGEVTSPPLLLARGEYLLGVSPAGGVGSYQVAIRSGEPLPTAAESEPNDGRDAGTTVAGAFALSADLQDSLDWYAWTLTEADAANTWQLTAQAALGNRIDLTLHDADGVRLASTSAGEAGTATLYDLQLPAGDYLLLVDGDRGELSPYLLSGIVQDPLPANRESEPNDELRQAIPWDGESEISGRLAAVNDDDYFTFIIAEDDQRFDLRLTADGRQSRTLCLLQPESSLRHCRTALGEISLPDLMLAPGEYILQIDGEADPDAFYRLNRHNTGMARPGEEREPNDVYLFASEMDDNLRASGRLVGDEWDVFRLEVSGAPQLWRLQAVGEGLNRLAYINTAGQITEQISYGQSQRRLRLSNLFLLPGTHFIGVRGINSDYRLMAIPLGPPPPGLELEPNSTDDQANSLRFDEPRIGLLNEAADTDFYRFTLASEEVVRLTVTAADDGNVRTRVFGEGTYRLAEHNAGIPPGETFIWENRVQPGEYWVQVTSDLISDSPYTVLLERLNPFLPQADIEPNNQRELASPFPPSFVARGTAIANNDFDWYRLPPAEQATKLTLTIEETHQLALYDQDGKILSNEFEWDNGTLTGQVQVGIIYFVRVSGDGPYELRLNLDGVTPSQDEPAALPGSITLEMENEAAASFWPTGQQLAGQLIVSAEAAAAADTINWHTSHYKIQPPQILETSDLADGGREIRFTLNLAADIPSGDYPLTVQLSDGRSRSLEAQAILQIDPNTAPENAQRVWTMPDTMLGGWNAAALSFGAQIATADSNSADRQPVLHDGYTPLNDVTRLSLDDGPAELTIDLAGDEPLPVSGILLNPQGQGRDFESLKEFELDLSVDGQTFTTVMSGVLLPTDIEQVFPLEEPVAARFARLRLIGNYSGGFGSVTLGEWKVVIAPGVPLSDDINLADPVNGGHLVYADPQPFALGDGVGYMVEDGRSPQVRLDGGLDAVWVFGFQHERAAQISRLAWVENPQTDPDQRLTTVQVQVSQDSPVGPWQEIAVLNLEAGTTALDLPQPVWARYVRLVARGSSAERFRPLGPDVIRIFERLPSEDYISILAEWGHYNRNGIYEWLIPPAAPIAAGEDNNDSRAEAQGVTSGEQIVGQVAIGRDVDWFRVDVGEDENAVVLDLTGTPTVDVQAFFEDEAGGLLPAAVDNSLSGRRIVTATVPADSTVYFRIEEPPRSVIFSWDTSGSVGAYVDTIYNALATFVEGVTPGEETANFLPFGGDLLLETWGEQPATLQQALNDYPRGDGSSDAETSLLQAADELAFQEGTRAVVLITDAVSPAYRDTAELWRALTAVRPRIFTMSINTNISIGEKPANEQDLMQSWAGVNSGHYDFLRTQAEMEVAFERATARLRRPASYAFVAQTAFVEPPGPGTLQLLSSSTGENAAASASLLGDTAVEIIVDASGSMQQPLGDSTRIEVARGVLDELVNEVLPDGLPVALRVFGNREGNFSCRTDLEIPLQPLDRELLAATVTEITPQNDANTAIGASLALVPEDLSTAAGPKLVILLTDGEETCGGDPQQVIADLRAGGIDVRVNIVGFAIDNEALKAEFAAWAEAGGGAYFDAADSEGLTDSLNQALRTPYQILDESGEVVANGLVDGDPVELPAGVYTAEILSEPVTVVEEIIIPGETPIVVRIQAGE